MSGKSIEFNGGNLNEAERCVFPSEILPGIECGHLTGLEVFERTLGDETQTQAAVDEGHLIELSVAESGWPEGFWIVELEVRRSESADWQVVRDRHGQRVPILVAVPTSRAWCDFRFLQFCKAHSAHATGTEFHLEAGEVNGHEAELLDLLTEIQTMARDGFAEAALPHFRWLEILYRELGKQAGRLLTSGEVTAADRLLNLACQEAHLSSGRSLFVTVPGLLGLSAERYTEIPTTQPLPKSLNWCARLARHPSVCDAFKDSIAAVDTWTLTLLGHFRNFAELPNANTTVEAGDDLHCFDYGRYRGQTVGFMRFRGADEIPQQPEWDEHNVLNRSHVEWALSELSRRRQGTLDNREWGGVNALLNSAPAFRDWLRESLNTHPKLMPPLFWNEPWLLVSFSDDALMENCPRFASLFALAARTSAAGWLPLQDAMNWLAAQGKGLAVSERAIATLVGMAPELFGYYLMFWELMIRTYPHE